MEYLYLIKLGELTLKSGNKRAFELRLRDNIDFNLKPDSCQIVMRDGRYFLLPGSVSEEKIRAVLSRVPGISGFARAIKTKKSMDAIYEAAKEATAARLSSKKGNRFKVESRRSDKSFPLDSQGISRELGAYLLSEFPSLTVDVHNPDWIINVEIREHAFLYIDIEPGQKGLPVGSSGKALLLLSGGIDSPVAGYLMAKRGLSLEAIHFHAYPFTSKEAQAKVEDLAALISRYVGPIKLHIIPFTAVQQKIKQGANEDETTLMLRACMMKAAHLVAIQSGLKCLITGESLGQVASQTVENMRFTESLTDLLILRPLAGMDKEGIIKIAENIGSYSLSILPYEDCCVLFSPKHPIIRCDYKIEHAHYEALAIDELIQKAVIAREEKIIDHTHYQMQIAPSD